MADRPIEILFWLERHPGAWVEFLGAHDGSVALAAYTLASVKNETRSRGVPTAVEVHVAAREIVERAHTCEFVPEPAALVDMVEAYGLPVI